MYDTQANWIDPSSALHQLNIMKMASTAHDHLFASVCVCFCEINIPANSRFLHSIAHTSIWLWLYLSPSLPVLYTLYAYARWFAKKKWKINK